MLRRGLPICSEISIAFEFSDEEHVQKGLAQIGRELQRLELHRSVVQRLNCPQALMPEYMQGPHVVLCGRDQDFRPLIVCFATVNAKSPRAR